MNEDVPEGSQPYGLYAALVGSVVYPSIENNPLSIEDIDADGDGIIDELKGVNSTFGDLYKFDVFYREIPSVESPSAVIDFHSIFSIMDSNESLTPVITDRSETPTIKLFSRNGLATYDDQSSLSSAAEYEITSFSIAILVPEPSSLGLLLFGLVAAPRRLLANCN